MIEINGVKDFNTDHIFDCGQCFRWNREVDGSYTGIAGKRPANIAYRDSTVVIDNAGDDELDFGETILILTEITGRLKRHWRQRTRLYEMP